MAWIGHYLHFWQQWLLGRRQWWIRFEMDCQPQVFELSQNSSWFLFCFCIYKIKTIICVNILIFWKKNGTRNCKQLIPSFYLVSVHKKGVNGISLCWLTGKYGRKINTLVLYPIVVSKYPHRNGLRSPYTVLPNRSLCASLLPLEYM